MATQTDFCIQRERMHFFPRRFVVLALVVAMAVCFASAGMAQGAAKPSSGSVKAVPPSAKPGTISPPAAVPPQLPGGGAQNPLKSQHDVSNIYAGSQIVAPTAGYHFPNGQVLTYAAEWHLFTAGIAVLRMAPEGPLQKVTATAESTGVVNLLFGVHDRFQATFDPKTFCSLSVFKHSEEGLHRRETQIHFENSRHKSVLEEKNLKTGEQKRVENDVPGCNTDVISGIFYLSTLNLNEGMSHTFPVADGGKVATVVARVEGKERLKTLAGTFDTVRVVAEATAEPMKSKGKLWIWYTDDATHTPVQMRARLAWGSLLFRLQSVEKATK